MHFPFVLALLCEQSRYTCDEHIMSAIEEEKVDCVLSVLLSTDVKWKEGGRAWICFSVFSIPWTAVAQHVDTEVVQLLNLYEEIFRIKHY